MRLGILPPEPHFRIMAYFRICWSKYILSIACVEEQCFACLRVACESET